MKKNHPNTNQLPRDSKGQRFVAWFPHKWNFIEADEFETNHPQVSRKARRQAWQEARKTASKKGKSKPNWRTETEYAIEPVVLWHRWKDPNDLVGVSFDSETKYALADVDAGSPIHPHNNELAFREWLRSFEDIGLVGYVIIRSSFSEGLNIYFPLPKLTGTFNLACALQICAEKAGIKVKSGELEFFPNTKNFCKYKPTAYKAHRMPLQSHTGSVILDDEFNPIGDSTELFCDQMEWAAARQDMDALEVACRIGREIINFRRFGSRNKTRLAKFKRDLEIMIAEGWTDEGQTNFLLGKIAAYGMIFTEHEGEELAKYIAQTAQGCDGYHEYCNHHHDIERRARDYGKSAERYYWKPGTPRKRAGTHKNFSSSTSPNHNQEVAQKAQNRIIDGVESLLQRGINLIVTGIVAFRDALREEIQKLHGVSVGIATLNKYDHLWHPKKKGIVLGTRSPQTSHGSPVSSSEQATKPKQESEPELLQEQVPEPEQIQEPEPVIEEYACVEQGDIEEKTPESILPKNSSKNTPLETPKRSQNNGCTHLVTPSKNPKTSKCSQSKGCTHLPLYEGLYDLDSLVGDRFLYLGKATGGLIELDSFQLPQMRTVQPNELVKLISTYHSSDLWDELPSRKIVYVQPIEQAKQEKWKDEAGIAVFLDQLERLKTQPEQNQKKSNKRSLNNSQSNFQPEIKQAHEQSIRVTYPPKSPTPPKIDNKPNLSFNPTTKLNQDLDVP